MADQTPVMKLSRMDGTVEGDCACPDMSNLFSEVSWVRWKDACGSDCACPDAGQARPQQTADYSGLWLRPPDLYSSHLPDDHEVVFAPTHATGIAVLSAPARRILDAFVLPRQLPQAVAILPDLAPDVVSRLAMELACHGLLCPANGTAALCRPVPQTLTAWLHITSRCNLHCAYCYVPRGDEVMDESTGRAAIDALFHSAVQHGFRAVKLKYAGGEPALNLERVYALHEYAETLAARTGLALRAVLLSNGVALEDGALRILREKAIRLALSLDGIGPVHDAQRGADTFARVTRTLERAVALGLTPHISVTVTARSAAGLPKLVAYLLDCDLAFNLNFYRETDYPLPGLWAGDEVLIAGVRAALAVIEGRLPRRSLVSGLLDRAILGVPHRHPCGVGQSYVVIDPRGRIARCHMTLDQIVGSVGADDPIDAIASGGLRNLDVDEKESCAGCTWRYWCAGGCPLLTRRLKGREDAPSPYCDVYRAIFPELLRLEGLRLLKWSPPVA